MFVSYLLHSYLLDPYNVKCLCAFETGICDIELSTYIPPNVDGYDRAVFPIFRLY